MQMVVAQHAMPHPDPKGIRSKVSAEKGSFFKGGPHARSPYSARRQSGGAERHLTMRAIFPGSYPLTLTSRSRWSRGALTMLARSASGSEGANTTSLSLT